MRRQIDFPEAEAAIKIRGKYLRALEDEQFELLPAETYVKGFLRTYAEYLGLDGQLYVDEYNSRFVAGEEYEARRANARRSNARPQRRSRKTETNIVLIALAAIGILTVIVISAWTSSDKDPSKTTKHAHDRQRAEGGSAAVLGHASARLDPRDRARRLGDRDGQVRRHVAEGRQRARHSRREALGDDRLAGEPADRRARQAGARAGTSAARDPRDRDGLAAGVALRAAIVASGSELVRGDRRDLNGPYLAASLLRLGFAPARITVVGDDPAELETAFQEGLTHDLLVVSGGLGPTHDDRTVELLARAAGVGLHVEEPLREAIEELSQRIAARLNRPYVDFADGVVKQATLPDGASWVGMVGTAPAVVLETGSCVAVALPGPPRELHQLWPQVLKTDPLVRLTARVSAPSRRALRFFGVSESAIARSLAAAGGDGDGVDVTICARDFELHVDLFVQDGADAARRHDRRAARRRCGAVSLLDGGDADGRARAATPPRARADAGNGRILHRRARRRAADGRSWVERRLRRRCRRLLERRQGARARRSGGDARLRTARSRPRPLRPWLTVPGQLSAPMSLSR